MTNRSEKTSPLELASLRLTRFIGTPASVVIHTFLFAGAFTLPFFGIEIERVLLVLTTLVSLEAIYLSIFIQMSVNENTASLAEVEEDIEGIHEEVEELGDEVEEIGEDVEEIAEDIDEIQEEAAEDEREEEKQRMSLEKIETGLQKLLGDIETLKLQKKE